MRLLTLIPPSPFSPPASGGWPGPRNLILCATGQPLWAGQCCDHRQTEPAASMCPGLHFRTRTNLRSPTAMHQPSRHSPRAPSPSLISPWSPPAPYRKLHTKPPRDPARPGVADPVEASNQGNSDPCDSPKPHSSRSPLAGACPRPGLYDIRQKLVRTRLNPQIEWSH